MSYSVFTLIRYMILSPWPLTFWSWTVVMHGGSRGQRVHHVWRFYAYPVLSHALWCLP